MMAAVDKCFDAGTLRILTEQIKGASLQISMEGGGFGGGDNRRRGQQGHRVTREGLEG